MARLCIRLLGPFRATLDGESVTRFETRKAQALLAYLAAEAGKPYQRGFLGEMLWPGRRQGAARANLRHTLSTLRLAIADRTPSDALARSVRSNADRPFLTVTRETIQLDPAADVWVDGAVFLELLEGQGPADRLPISKLEEAVDLYRGAFLEGISIEDSALFHEWLLLEREKYRRQAADAFSLLTGCYEIQHRFERALEHARRQLALEPWDEGGHRQVMRLLAFTGRRAAALTQYEACCQLLAEDLAVTPEMETTELFERIRDDRLEIPAQIREPPLLEAAPGFLEAGAQEAEPALFLARQRELARLGSFLDQAMAGRGQVVFVTGGPGQGKTALLTEFARRALNARSDLLVARGCCSAYASVGDPYLPFRDVLTMLTGEVEARWAAGSISRDHARRLWDALPMALGTLLARGPLLVGSLLPGEALLSRAAAVLPQRLDWLERLQALTIRARDHPVGLGQSFLFEQLTTVLQALADQQPLLLLLDDVQWSDPASAGLLFHLGRRLAGRRILIICAYRPEEIVPGPTGECHPLAKALREFKRTFGAVWVDLDRASDAERHRFVDALLDSEPNRLDTGFREALFRRTAGQPLFTLELLRAMQERGELVQDAADGAWIEGPTLDWGRPPARIEAVVEQRVGRLGTELRHILGVASVEGEVFTAQVVASVIGVAEGELLQRLGQELEAHHRLVSEEAEVDIGTRRLDRYRFRHILVQDHVYRRLTRGQKRLLHREVANALEGLYGSEEQREAIAPQLAFHFQRAGRRDKVIHYLRQAGERELRLSAYQEAAAHLAQALALCQKT